MAQGLIPVRYKDGAPYNGAANRYYVPASDSTALFVGDPVILAGSGDANGVPSVTRAAAGDRITGVVVGFAPLESASAGSTTAINRGYRTASTEDYVLVADDTDLVFEATEDGTGGFLAVTNIGNNIDLVAGSGSTTTKKSGYALDSSTAATTAAQMRILGMSQTVNNTIGTTSTLWQVAIVEGTETPAAGTTGV